MKSRGVALLLLIGTIVVTGILAAAISNIVLNQTRFSQHQVSRIRAYYAALAAMNLAMDNLRTGAWTTGTYTFCDSGCDVNDADILHPVSISISDVNATGIRTINITSDYTYNP